MIRVAAYLLEPAQKFLLDLRIQLFGVNIFFANTTTVTVCTTIVVPFNRLQGRSCQVFFCGYKRWTYVGTSNMRSLTSFRWSSHSGRARNKSFDAVFKLLRGLTSKIMEVKLYGSSLCSCIQETTAWWLLSLAPTPSHLSESWSTSSNNPESVDTWQVSTSWIGSSCPSHHNQRLRLKAAMVKCVCL